MSNAQLEATIDAAWEARDTINPATKGAVRDAVEAALAALDSGTLRVAAKEGGEWGVQQWLKKAVLPSFRLTAMSEIAGGPGGAPWWDQVALKFPGWAAAGVRAPGFR